jgi:hypothetical protein
MSDSAERIETPPRACPFVALEEDRDRRAFAPDPRHRCYAVPVPEPRALPHQAAYCLSSAFSSCAFFLAWAARAAADPVEADFPAGPAGTTPDQGSRADVAADPVGRSWATPPPWVAQPHLTSTERLPAPFEQIAAVPDRADGADGHNVGMSTADLPQRTSSGSRPTVPPQPEAHADSPSDTSPAVTNRLTGRRAGAVLPPRFGLEPGQRDAIPGDAPSGRTRNRRFEAYPTLGHRIRMRGISPFLVGVFALMIATLVLFLLPEFLSGRGSVAEPSAPPSGSAVASVAAPTSAPVPTPRSYTVRKGDALSTIAKSLGLAVGQIVCFNRLKNPNVLAVGQVLLIPPPDYTCPPKGGGASPRPRASN